MSELETVIQEAIERHAKECCGHLDVDGRGPELLAELNRRGYQLVRKDPFAKPEWSDATELEGSNEAVFGAHQDGMDCGFRPCRACAPVLPDVLTDRQGVLDAFAERLTKIEDRFDQLFEPNSTRPAPDTWLDVLANRVNAMEERVNR